VALTPFPRVPHVFAEAALGAMREGETVRDTAKLAANWINNEYLPRWNASSEKLPSVAIPEGLPGSVIGYLIRKVRGNEINARTAKDLLTNFGRRPKKTASQRTEERKKTLIG
jgi:Asp-tRNA(Asn)/Glu-tRNA(Gln) amidotransferase B subunit